MVEPSTRGRPLGAWCSMALAVLLFVTLAPMVLAQDPPRFPSGGAGEDDDLALVPREWTETNRNGTVIDLVGTSHEVPAWEVAYRIHGDIAAVEGTLVSDADTLSPRPIFNTGLRLDRIEFDPPLRFTDGANLSTAFPPGLNWSFDDSHTFAGTVYRLVTDLMPDHEANVSVQWDLQVLANVDGVMRLPAPPFPSAVMMHQGWTIVVPAHLLQNQTALNETTVTLRFLFDFGDTTRLRSAYGQGGLDAAGLYLFRGNGSATFRVTAAADRSQDVRFATGPDRTALGNATEISSGPVHVAVTAAVIPFMYDHGGGHHVQVTGDFGYLVDLPDPIPTPSPGDGETDDTPTVPLPLVLLATLAMALLLRRTEAHT